MDKRNFFIVFFIFCLAYAGYAGGEKKFLPNPQRVIGDIAIMAVNNVELPLNNDGSTGESGQGYYPAGSNLTFLYQGGLASSGYVNGDLRCSWMAKSSLIHEWQPAKWGMDPDDPQARFYTVSINDGPGSPAYLEWAEAVALGADFIDENSDGMYDPSLLRQMWS